MVEKMFSFGDDSDMTEEEGEENEEFIHNLHC